MILYSTLLHLFLLDDRTMEYRVIEENVYVKHTLSSGTVQHNVIYVVDCCGGNRELRESGETVVSWWMV